MQLFISKAFLTENHFVNLKKSIVLAYLAENGYN